MSELREAKNEPVDEYIEEFDLPEDINDGFTEPVLRCDSCNKIVTKNVITKLGLCNHCGNKRFRSVDVISELELMQIKKLDGAEAFLRLFKEVPDEE